MAWFGFWVKFSRNLVVGCVKKKLPPKYTTLQVVTQLFSLAGVKITLTWNYSNGYMHFMLRAALNSKFQVIFSFSCNHWGSGHSHSKVSMLPRVNLNQWEGWFLQYAIYKSNAAFSVKINSELVFISSCIWSYNLHLVSVGSGGWIWILCKASAGHSLFGSKLLRRIRQRWWNDVRRREPDVLFSSKVLSF